MQRVHTLNRVANFFKNIIEKPQVAAKSFLGQHVYQLGTPNLYQDIK